MSSNRTELVVDVNLIGRSVWSRAFREWERRYREDPTQFASEMDRASAGLDDYGDKCAAYFAALVTELV